MKIREKAMDLKVVSILRVISGLQVFLKDFQI